MTIDQAITELKEIKNDMVLYSWQDKALNIAIMVLEEKKESENEKEQLKEKA